MLQTIKLHTQKSFRKLTQSMAGCKNLATAGTMVGNIGKFLMPKTSVYILKMTLVTKSDVKSVARIPIERVTAKPFTSVVAVR